MQIFILSGLIGSRWYVKLEKTIQDDDDDDDDDDV